MRYALLLLLTLPLAVFAGPDEPVPYAFPDEQYSHFDWTTFEQWGPANEKINARTVDYSLLQAAIFYYTNQYRVSKKLNALSFQPALGSAAIHQTTEMANRRFYAHNNPYDRSMKTVVDRAKKFGYDSPTVGENIALEFLLEYKGDSNYWYESTDEGYKFYYGDSKNKKGYVGEHTYLSLGKSIVAAWINSPSHRANMLFKHYTHMGAGVYLEPASKGQVKIPRIYAAQVFGG